MVKDHPYAFNMGHNNIIRLQDIQLVLKTLMERTMPEVLHNKQTEAVVMPETHLPNMPRVVDEPRYMTRKRKLDAAELQFLGMKQGTEDSQVARGDLAEKELFQELKKFYKNKKVVVFHGPKLRLPGKGKGSEQEFDFVVFDLELKAVIGIESKATLNLKTGVADKKSSAAAQTKKLKEFLEQYFAPELASSDWCFIAMVHYNSLALKQPICSTCLPFTIHGANQLANKLDDLKTHLEAVRPQWIPSHQEYVSLVQLFCFVLLAHPISTRCTINSDVHAKVVGKPETSTSKAKVGQGDYKSIIFWTNEQSKVMMWDQQFVVFVSSWGTGKTICQREKARIRATDNPCEKLYFCVVRELHHEHNPSQAVAGSTTNTTLLELELKLYFQEHNLKNVTVLGLPSSWDDTMSDLQKKMRSLPAGSWMVDELMMPDPKYHTKWAGELQQMRSHMVGQPASPLLWISIAGIWNGKAEHFKHTYLAPLMSGFHMPVMEIPLRNTSETIKLARLDPNKDPNKPTYVTSNNVTTNPSYSLPPNLMSGIECRKIKVTVYDQAALEKAAEAACKEILVRSGGKGLPILLEWGRLSVPVSMTVSGVVAAVRRVVGASTLLYTGDGSEKNEATEAEVEEWVSRWKRGEETRLLLTDDRISRGFEAKELLVIARFNTENLVMRACGFSFLIKLD